MPRFAANISFLFQELAFLDRFAEARAEGFDAVEFMFAYDHAPAAVAARVRDAGLSVGLINMPAGNWEAGERGLTALPARRQEFRAALAQALDYAGALNCPRIHVVAGIEPPGADRRALEACYLDNLAWASEQARPSGIVLTIEPINRRDIPGFFLHDFDHAERLLGELGASNVKLQFDVYHCQVIHGDLTRRLERLFPLIGHVQIANPPDRREPGRGEIDFGHVFATLDRLGYEGWVGCEYKPEGVTADSLDWIRPYGVARARR